MEVCLWSKEVCSSLEHASNDEFPSRSDTLPNSTPPPDLFAAQDSWQVFKVPKRALSALCLVAPLRLFATTR